MMNTLVNIVTAIAAAIVGIFLILVVLNVFGISHVFGDWDVWDIFDDDNDTAIALEGDINGDGKVDGVELALAKLLGQSDSTGNGGNTGYTGPTMFILNGLKCANGTTNSENYPGPTTAEVKSATATDYQRVGTECSAFTFRDPSGKTHDTVCPVGYVCTYTLADGSVKVYIGDGAHYQASAATVRWHAVYPDGDAVKDNPPCGLVSKEDIFGQGDVPSFRATAGNFSCNGSGVSTQSQTTIPGSVNIGGQTYTGTVTVPDQVDPPAPAPQAPACDTSVLGGTWTHVSGNQYAGSGYITGNSAWIIHTPTYPGNPGLPAGASEQVDMATGYCPP